MAPVTMEMVKELRERTGAGIKKAKDTLLQTDGDMKRAIELLREEGLKVSDKVAGREAREGRVEVYIHAGSRMATMVEVNCETDFVGRNEEFVQLCKDIALHIAAMNPTYMNVEDVPAEKITESGMSADKFYEEHVLLKQPYVRDGSQTIEERIKNVVAKLRENIMIRRYIRYELGA